MLYSSLFNRSLPQLCWEFGNLRVLSEASTHQLCEGLGSLFPWASNFCKYGCSCKCNKKALMMIVVSQSSRNLTVKFWIALAVAKESSKDLIFGDIFIYRWWEIVALPSDVDPIDEWPFRVQMKDLVAQVFTWVHLCGATPHTDTFL
jgi:hypothetical protein